MSASAAAAVPDVRAFSQFVNLSATTPKVLIVEDQLTVRWQLLEHFRTMGIEALTASAGFEAIRLAGVHRPDLILLDGLVPDMHGFEIARFVRNIDRDYRPYIVFMTGIYKNIRYRNEAKLKYGIDDYIIKPVALESLDAILSHTRAVL